MVKEGAGRVKEARVSETTLEASGGEGKKRSYLGSGREV